MNSSKLIYLLEMVVVPVLVGGAWFRQTEMSNAKNDIFSIFKYFRFKYLQLNKDGLLCLSSLIFLLSLHWMITEISTHPRHDRIEKILVVDDEPIDEIARSRVKQKLAEDAEYLLQKKKREQEKRERVKRMQENYEKQRANKLKLITQKSIKSMVVQQKNKQLLSKRFKQKSEHYKSVINKIEHQNVQEIQKAFRQRQDLFQASYNQSRSQAKSLKDNHLHSKTQIVRPPQTDVDYQMHKISQKTKKAQQQHEIQQKTAIERAKSMSRHVAETQKRAHDLSYQEQNEALKNYYERSEQMQKIYHRAKSLNEKKLLEKRKTFKDKLEKCNENLKHLSYLEQEKFQQLQKKFDKKYQPKQWKDHRLQRYKQKWEENSKRIEQQKQEKAQKILHKHQQITQQNRTYKEKRDKLLQAVKFGEV